MDSLLSSRGSSGSGGSGSMVFLGFILRRGACLPSRASLSLCRLSVSDSRALCRRSAFMI